MARQDQLTDAQRDYVDSIRGGVGGSLNPKEFAYALDSFLNGTAVDKVVTRIVADRDEEGLDRQQDDPSATRH